VRAYRTIRSELASYGHGLAEKPETIVLNKSDAVPKAALARKRSALEKASGHKVLIMSGVTGEGVDGVLSALAKAVEKSRKRARASDAPARSWAP
jgi:GTP-binding protein